MDHLKRREFLKASAAIAAASAAGGFSCIEIASAAPSMASTIDFIIVGAGSAGQISSSDRLRTRAYRRRYDCPDISNMIQKSAHVCLFLDHRNAAR